MPPKKSNAELRQQMVRAREQRNRTQRRAAQLPQELYRRQTTGRPIRTITANRIRASQALSEAENYWTYLQTKQPRDYVTRMATLFDQMRHLKNVMKNPGDYYWTSHGFRPNPPPPPPSAGGGGAAIFT